MAKKVQPPQVPQRGRGGEEPQERPDDTNVREEVPEGGWQSMFSYDPPTPPPDKKNPEDRERFKDFLGRLTDGDEDVPEGVQRLVDGKDFDTLWFIWSAAIRE